jgi:predicted nuclease of predicted toxin-antitoxin system
MHPRPTHSGHGYPGLAGWRSDPRGDIERLPVSGVGRHYGGARICSPRTRSSRHSDDVNVRFLVDAQLPPVLARQLATSGHEAVHVADVGMLSARDRDIWEHAATTEATLITKDEDFVTMRALNTRGPAVVWVRVGNTTNRQLLARFAAVLSAVVSALQRGETVVEISDS